MDDIDYSSPTTWHKLHTDPLSPQTRRDRRSLLALSIVGLVIAKTGHTPKEISPLGIHLSTTDAALFLLLLLGAIIYLLIIFSIYGGMAFGNRRREFTDYQEKVERFEGSMAKLGLLAEPKQLTEEVKNSLGEIVKKDTAQRLLESLKGSFNGLPELVARLENIRSTLEKRLWSVPEEPADIASELIRKEISHLKPVQIKLRRELARARTNFLFRLSSDFLFPTLLALFSIGALLIFLCNMPPPPEIYI